jgi:hypothetical protein
MFIIILISIVYFDGIPNKYHEIFDYIDINKYGKIKIKIIRSNENKYIYNDKLIVYTKNINFDELHDLLISLNKYFRINLKIYLSSRFSEVLYIRN